MAVYEINGMKPTLDPTTWIAESAEVVAYVHFGANTSVWFGAIIRADNEPMVIGEGTNIQEASVLHSDPANRSRSVKT